MKRVIGALRVPYNWVLLGLLMFALGLSFQSLQGLFVGLILSWAAGVLRLLYTLRQEQRQLNALLTVLVAKGGEGEADAAGFVHQS